MMDTTTEGETTDLLIALVESQARCLELEEELALTGDELARCKALFNQFVDAWKDDRRTLKKQGFWSRLFS